MHISSLSGNLFSLLVLRPKLNKDNMPCGFLSSTTFISFTLIITPYAWASHFAFRGLVPHYLIFMVKTDCRDMNIMCLQHLLICHCPAICSVQRMCQRPSQQYPLTKLYIYVTLIQLFLCKHSYHDPPDA